MERRKSRRNADNTPGRQTNNTIESVDRISALPDSILGVILSLLPTKNALATSALSKRWEFLWRTVHTLDFCFDAEGYDPRPTDENEKFVRFVNHVLLHHDAGVLNKFRLLWIPTLSPATSSHATSWIKTAITRNVHELSVSMFNHFPLPLSVFSCDSLRSLKLEGFIELSAATVFSLPRLESLDLYGVAFRSDETFEKMIRGCPVLSYLHIFIDDDFDEFSFIISSTSLRRLELELGRYKSLKLKASSLEHLKLYGYNISVNFLQKKLTSLVEANFGIFYHPDNEDFSQAGICNSVVDAVSALDCVKILTLSEEVMRALSCATINLSADFKRLVKLETRTCCCACSSLQGFIQRSNNLQLLTVHKSPRYKDNGDYHDHSIWTAPTDVPICFSNSLKKVVVYGYRGLEDERAMIRYMFEHGSALEVVQISSNEDTSSEEECNRYL